MENRNLKQKDLAKILDCSETRISEILSRKRPVSFEIAKKLYQRFGISAEAI